MRRCLVIILFVLSVCIINGCKRVDKEDSKTSGQAVQNQSNTKTVVLGRVTKEGDKITVFDTNGKQVTSQSQPNTQLIGVGNDFFVIKSTITNTFTTYDVNFRKISHISQGGTEGNSKRVWSASVQGDIFTITLDNSKFVYDKNCKKK